jgi:hypothetical protein
MYTKIRTEDQKLASTNFYRKQLPPEENVSEISHPVALSTLKLPSCGGFVSNMTGMIDSAAVSSSPVRSQVVIDPAFCLTCLS